jgi:hypothetical protein
VNNPGHILSAFIAGAFGLIMLYLILDRASGADQVLTGFGSASSTVFRTLQGR